MGFEAKSNIGERYLTRLNAVLNTLILAQVKNEGNRVVQFKV
jgi:hypothetical protein